MKINPLVVWTIGGATAAVVVVALSVSTATHIGPGARVSPPTDSPSNGPPVAPAPPRSEYAPPGIAASPPTAPIPPSELLAQPGALTATLQSVNANGTLSYLPMDAKPGTESQKLLVSRSTDIRLNGAPANLNALKPGMDIAFLAADADQALSKLEAFSLLPDGKPHTKEGLVGSAAPDSVVLLVGRNNVLPCPVQTTPQTVVTLDGKPVKPADLRPKMMATIEFINSTARTITASSTRIDGKPHSADGLIVRASPAELVIRTSGDDGFDVHMRVDPDIKIRREVPADIPNPHGGIGLGSQSTAVEYRDLQVTHADATLLQSDFSQGLTGWTPSAGTWATAEGALTQTTTDANCRILTDHPAWTDCTYRLRARKTSGREGFLILFHVLDDKNYTSWHLGGWNNTRSALEYVAKGSANSLGTPANVRIAAGRWYDIRIEMAGRNIRCFLDDQLITEATDTLSPKAVKKIEIPLTDLRPALPAIAWYKDGIAGEVTLTLPDPATAPATNTSSPH
jgi:hypothetical protein